MLLREMSETVGVGLGSVNANLVHNVPSQRKLQV